MSSVSIVSTLVTVNQAGVWPRQEQNEGTERKSPWPSIIVVVPTHHDLGIEGWIKAGQAGFVDQAYLESSFMRLNLLKKFRENNGWLTDTLHG